MTDEHRRFGDHTDQKRFRRLADGRLPEAEFQALEERLLAEPELRAQYVRFMELEAGLYDALVQQPRLPARSPKHSRGRWLAGIMAAACIVLAFVGVTLWSVAGRGGRPSTQFIEARLRGLKDAAVVTRVTGVVTEPGTVSLLPGTRLKPGVLALAEGQLQLEFFCGAQLVIEGPAELHILSAESATLVSGKAAARVSDAARGFVLNSPEAAVVDLGTEFAINVDSDGSSEVQVIDGEVEVSLLGDDGNTLSSHRLEQEGSLRVTPESSAIRTVGQVGPPLLRVADTAATSGELRVTEQYVQLVKAARPLVYWRFELEQNGLVPNEMGPRWGARLHSPAEQAGALQIHEGILQFGTAPGPRYLQSDEPFSQLNAAAFSVEFWVNPSQLHWATLLGIAPASDREFRNHLNVVELAHHTSLVHDPGAFRFLHRQPPGPNGGVNLFSSKGCTPGQWHHLVIVKTPGELRLYMNGELSRKLELAPTPAVDDGDYQLILGQLRTVGQERQFLGAIDEVAVYTQALSDEETRRHYRSLMKPVEVQ
jgi:hypothetical protein